MFEAVADVVRDRRQFGLCRCCVCKVVGRCTPATDYFTHESHGDELLCEPCFDAELRKEAAAAGRPLVLWSIGFPTPPAGHAKTNCSRCSAGDHFALAGGYRLVEPGILAVKCGCCGLEGVLPAQPTGAS